MSCDVHIRFNTCLKHKSTRSSLQRLPSPEHAALLYFDWTSQSDKVLHRKWIESSWDFSHRFPQPAKTVLQAPRRTRGDSPTPGLPESVVNSVHFSSPVCRPVRGSSASVDRRPQLLLWVRRRESPQNLRTNERKKSRCQERMEIFSMSLIRWKKKSVDGCLNISLMTWRIILGDSILDISRYTRACV